MLTPDLIEEGWLKTPRIIEAFKAIERSDFMPKGMEGVGESSSALPIGFGQTISQPLVVAFMFEELQPKPGEKILDIGSGSGWTTALLAEIVGGEGRVIGVEIVPELSAFGRKNISKYSFIKKGIADIVYGDGAKGYSEEAPFDKILCSAAIGWQREKGALVQDRIPGDWKEQLKVGGRMVVPMENSIWVFDKVSEEEFKAIEHPGFVFVPLVAESDR